jgi:DNA ligase (NAD+)
MIAVKFKAPSAKVTIKDIIYTQKKSGALTPVVLYDPVLLDGSYPSRATAYNYNNLKVLHIGIGAEVLITKSGDIIPVVDKVLKRSDNIPMPDVEYYISGKHMYAVNMEVSTSYKFVLGLKLLQIDGIGETLAMQIGAIVDYDIIKLFDTANKPAIRLVLGGGKVWDKFDIFYQTRTLTLDMLINLLQFNGCGKVLSRTFANIILGDKSQSVAGIDKNVLNMVCRGEGFKRINDAMKLLVTYGVRVVRPIKIDDSSLTFEMTGTPPGMTKGEFAAKLKQQYPNSVHVSLTKDTKVLFVDTLSSNSSKLNRARKYNLRILTYEQGLKGEA